METGDDKKTLGDIARKAEKSIEEQQPHEAYVEVQMVQLSKCFLESSSSQSGYDHSRTQKDFTIDSGTQRTRVACQLRSKTP